MTNKEFISEVSNMSGLDYDEVKDVYSYSAQLISSKIYDTGKIHVPYLVNFTLSDGSNICIHSSITDGLKKLIKHKKTPENAKIIPKRTF